MAKVPDPSPLFTTLSNSASSPTAVYTLSPVTNSGTVLLVPNGIVLAPSLIYTGVPVSATGSPIITTSTPSVSNTTASSTPSVTPNTGLVPDDNSTPIASSPSSASPSTSSNTSPSTSLSTSTSSSSASHAPATTSAPPSPSRLPNGTVAGIVIGVAIGVALITFLVTLLAIRRRRGSGGKRPGQASDRDGGLVGSARQQTLSPEPKQPLVTQTSSGSNSFDNFLPQSADDRTVQHEMKTVLDQIELHVENFYQNTQAFGSRLADAELAMFDSPYLPSSLASLLPQTNNKIPLIKHALTHFITACITTPSDTDWSLLPKDFVLLPNAVRAGGSSKSKKQGFTQSMSRWRALTAYLRPNTMEDAAYIAQRERQINTIVQNFSVAFAPWQNPKYEDEKRVHSLVAILKDAADKGIWLFSQPSEFQFQWRKLGSGRIAVAPALVKVTDERGQILAEPQVMIDSSVRKV